MLKILTKIVNPSSFRVVSRANFANYRLNYGQGGYCELDLMNNNYKI